eukprot:6216100-Ditylum_brightwellii.AAC.1
MASSPVPSCKKRGCIFDFDNMLVTFPTRKAGSRELHARKRAEQSFKGACVYCSTLYQQKKEAGSDISHQNLFL